MVNTIIENELPTLGAAAISSVARLGQKLVPAIFLVLTAYGCGSSGENASAIPPVNRAPSISGTPTTSVVQDTPYSFIPTASDADGDPITFSITGLPSWAAFESNTGALTGTPAGTDLGTYADIRIGVGDGQSSTSLSSFDIEVVATALGSLTISWTAPTVNSDGSPLKDLTGYRIRWGTQSGVYTNMSEINNPSLTRYVIDNVVSAEYFLVISAIDNSDNESANSNEARGVVD